jgi:hypothetical protein
MTVDKDKLQTLIAECRYGVSGRGPAIEVANDLLTDCCDNLESLLAEIDRLKGLQPSLPPRPPEGYGLPRFGLRWNGPSNPLAVSMDDGYWTPWHLADELRKDAERYRWLRENHILAHVQVTQRDGTEPYVYAEELDRSVDDILAAIADKKTGD